jgi:hypothetical protein
MRFTPDGDQAHAAFQVLPPADPNPRDKLAKEKEAIQVEKEQIDNEVELSTWKMKLIKARSRLAQAKAEADGSFKPEIDKIVGLMSDKHLKRLAIVRFEKSTRSAILEADGLTDEEKQLLVRDLKHDVSMTLIQEGDIYDLRQ